MKLPAQEVLADNTWEVSSCSESAESGDYVDRVEEVGPCPERAPRLESGGLGRGHRE